MLTLSRELDNILFCLILTQLKYVSFTNEGPKAQIFSPKYKAELGIKLKLDFKLSGIFSTPQMLHKYLLLWLQENSDSTFLNIISRELEITTGI